MEANYVRLKSVKDKGFFEYEVRFHPELDSRNARFGCLRSLEHKLGKSRNFDGVKLYLPHKLPNNVFRETVQHPSQGQVEVEIRFKKENSFGSPLAIPFYNILFKRVMEKLQMVRMGNKNHYLPKNVASPEMDKLQ